MMDGKVYVPPLKIPLLQLTLYVGNLVGNLGYICLRKPLGFVPIGHIKIIVLIKPHHPVKTGGRFGTFAGKLRGSIFITSAGGRRTAGL